MEKGAHSERLLAMLHEFSVAPSRSLVARLARFVSWAGFVTLVVWTSPAVDGRRSGAVARLWAWQIWRRTVRRPIEVCLPTGLRLRFPTWSVLAGVTAATGLHEPSDQLFVASFLRSGDGVVDIGANLGIYTIACAALDARVAAFEPASRTRTALEENIRINGLGSRIRVYALAAGDANGRAGLTTGLDVSNHLVDDDNGAVAQEVIEVRTLDSLLVGLEEWLEPSLVSLLKVDAEGHDLQVLRGGVRLIETHRPVILVESWEGGTEIRALLAAVGYSVHRYDIEDHRLIEYPADWAGQCNFIGVPKERLPEVESRLAGRPPPRPEPPCVRWWVGHSVSDSGQRTGVVRTFRP